MAIVYPNGYGTQTMTLEELAARHAPKMLHEYARRLFAMIEFSEGLVGIGNSWRSTETQAANYAKYPGRFARPGSSFHETHLWASGESGCAAVDTVGINGRHNEAWNFVAAHGLQFGLLTFANVNSEPWHTQCLDLDKSVSSWKNNGRRNPMRWELPRELDIDFGFDDGIDPDQDPDTKPIPNTPPSVGDNDVLVLNPPQRVLDSRINGGAWGANETRLVDVQTNKAAVFVNVTVAYPAASGYITLWGAGPKPGPSNVNYLQGQTIANSAWVPVVNGHISVYSKANTHIIVDVQATSA